MQSLAEWKFGSCNVGDKKKQEDLLDLITALLKFMSSLSTTVAAQYTVFINGRRAERSGLKRMKTRSERPA